MDKKARYKAARRHAELTQKQLAERVPMSQQMVSKLEQGLTADSAFDIKIATVCGVRAEWLDAGQGEMVGPSGPARTTGPRLQVEIDDLQSALGALVTAAARSTPKLAVAYHAELGTLPGAGKSAGIFGVLRTLLEHELPTLASGRRPLPASAARGTTAHRRG